MTIPAFPKIFSIGSQQTERLFQGEVEITEKIDGSQIGFGIIDGELIIRSKGCRIFPETADKMFKKGVEYILSIQDKLSEGVVYYGEYLKSNKHNVLAYDREPKNNIMLYGIVESIDKFHKHAIIKERAEELGLEVVPLLFKGKVETIEDLKSNLDRVSELGKCKIEGFVVKNYNEQLLIDGQVIPILMGKYVSEQFKEVHNKEWKSQSTGKGRWEVYKSQFCNTARWCKAIQHLRDSGQLTNSPKDIGALLREVNTDIEAEEKENIKEFLWDEFGKEVLREAGKGLPIWYKERLLNEQPIKNMGSSNT